MNISATAISSFLECPAKYQEKFLNGLDKPSEPMLLGRRFAELQAQWYGNSSEGTLLEDERLESEAQLCMAAYRSQYPSEPFKVLDTEVRFELPLVLNGKTYPYQVVGRFDATIEESDGTLGILETKLQSRNSQRNKPNAWAVKVQGSLYTWAAEQVFGRTVDTLLLNVCLRPSKTLPPSFRPRARIVRTHEQKVEALQTALYVCEQIERLKYERGAQAWPMNRDRCVSDTGWDCEYYAIHLLGRTTELLNGFVPLEELLVK